MSFSKLVITGLLAGLIVVSALLATSHWGYAIKIINYLYFVAAVGVLAKLLNR